MSFPRFHGNAAAAATLAQMASSGRIPQTLLLHGPAGIGKATLVRRFASALLGEEVRIEQDDLSLPHNQEMLAERAKLAADKRNDEPLFLAANPDFVTFPPDGPMRQITIPQVRLLRDVAQQRPLKGNRRVFLLDQVDRANEQAANSLLKTLEEPPEHLIIAMTAQNAYDLLPTIRSRSVALRLLPLGEGEMSGFLRDRVLDNPERRLRLAPGSPGLAISLDLAAYDRRRAAMLTLLEVAAGAAPFAQWVKVADAVAAKREERLESLLEVLSLLLEDVLVLQQGGESVRNDDVRAQLAALAERVSFRWLHLGVKKVDEMAEMARRNIQKAVALDAFAAGWKAA